MSDIWIFDISTGVSCTRVPSIKSTCPNPFCTSSHSLNLSASPSRDVGKLLLLALSELTSSRLGIQIERVRQQWDEDWTRDDLISLLEKIGGQPQSLELGVA